MEEKTESFKLSKNTSAKTYAKTALGAGIVKLIFSGGGVIGDFAGLLAIICGIVAIVKNKEKDRNTRAMAILGMILAFVGVVIKVLIEFPK